MSIKLLTEHHLESINEIIANSTEDLNQYSFVRSDFLVLESLNYNPVH